MKEDQFIELCKACDSTLLAEDSSRERVAIPWLHVIREHPVFLSNYDILFEKLEIKRFYFMLKRKVIEFLRIQKQIISTLRSDGEKWYSPNSLPKNIDVLFLSHLISESQTRKNDDFYFGDVPNEISERGYSSVIGLINHTSISGSTLANHFKDTTVQRIVFSHSMLIDEYLSLRHHQRIESQKLKAKVKNENPSLYRDVIAFASSEALSSATLQTLKLSENIGNLISILKPKAIVFTYEGHSLERMVFWAARIAFPNIKCIGYQHAAIFKKQHAIKRNLNSQYNPDHILTAGQVGKNQLQFIPSLQGIPVSILGSKRGFVSQTGKEKTIQKNKNINKIRENACLVLPEGILSECLLLFEYSLRCALLFPEMQFIWRLHPIISQKIIQNKVGNFQKLPNNVRFSNSTMEEDIESCQWALYRGTTAIIQAIGGGLRPIYYRIPGEMTINPLYELDAIIDKAETENDFKEIVTTFNRKPKQKVLADNEILKKYCENYYSPFNCQQLTNLLS